MPNPSKTIYLYSTLSVFPFLSKISFINLASRKNSYPQTLLLKIFKKEKNQEPMKMVLCQML